MAKKLEHTNSVMLLLHVLGSGPIMGHLNLLLLLYIYIRFNRDDLRNSLGVLSSLSEEYIGLMHSENVLSLMYQSQSTHFAMNTPITWPNGQI